MNKFFAVFCFSALSFLGACAQEVPAGCNSAKAQTTSSCSSAGNKYGNSQSQASSQPAQVDPAALIRELEALRRGSVAQTPESEKRQKELEQQLATLQKQIDSQRGAKTQVDNGKEKAEKGSQKKNPKKDTGGENGLGDFVKNVPNIVNTVGSVITGVRDIFGSKSKETKSSKPAKTGDAASSNEIDYGDNNHGPSLDIFTGNGAIGDFNWGGDTSAEGDTVLTLQ